MDAVVSRTGEPGILLCAAFLHYPNIVFFSKKTKKSATISDCTFLYCVGLNYFLGFTVKSKSDCPYLDAMNLTFPLFSRWLIIFRPNSPKAQAVSASPFGT